MDYPPETYEPKPSFLGMGRLENALFRVSHELMDFNPHPFIILGVLLPCYVGSLWTMTSYESEITEHSRRYYGKLTPSIPEGVTHEEVLNFEMLSRRRQLLPDTRREMYSTSDLASFIGSIGDSGRHTYTFYLFVVLSAAFIWTMFMSMLVSAVVRGLVKAESDAQDEEDVVNQDAEKEREEFRKDMDEISRRLPAEMLPPSFYLPRPFHALLLINIVPLVIFIMQIAEAFLLWRVVVNYTLPHDSIPTWATISETPSLVSLAVSASNIEAAGSRLLTIFTAITLTFGWARILLGRVKRGEPIWGKPRRPVIPVPTFDRYGKPGSKFGIPMPPRLVKEMEARQKPVADATNSAGGRGGGDGRGRGGSGGVRPPPGLTRASEITEQVWRGAPANERNNNKKKR
ncbi:uncharacterized protein EV422DRAFT_527276 [Fimicolochytrium jonesii]|uniref:uncharacterized protein n=1 Tax=Fimicolochytrium jonesii TaxID=1396493 RepID=UPI0022FED499|nr:uncharacterized protein EV422DRAFT_527276 [Fimicolochytrium jonesii]KAI8821848.1 hypothetical protein EV422DRAFT_527276 [Fimicolochytrium jonesii]